MTENQDTDGELWVLDRIEDGEAVVLVSDSGIERVVPRELLPAGAREGDAFREGGDGYVHDPEATERRRERARRLRDSIRKGPPGPISL